MPPDPYGVSTGSTWGQHTVQHTPGPGTPPTVPVLVPRDCLSTEVYWPPWRGWANQILSGNFGGVGVELVREKAGLEAQVCADSARRGQDWRESS